MASFELGYMPESHNIASPGRGQPRLPSDTNCAGISLDPFHLEQTPPHQSENCQSAALPMHNAAVDPQKTYLDELHSDLDSLSLEAETILWEFPRDRQFKLVAETRFLFNQYKHFGSMARLSRGIEKLLRLGVERETLMFNPTPQNRSNQSEIGRPPKTAKERAHFGEAFMTNHTCEDDKDKCDELNDNSTARHPLRIIDPDSISYVTTLPWDPLGTKFSWPNSIHWPKGLLGKINQILSIVDYEARVQLFYYVTKYGPSPIFRAGITTQIQTHYSSIFETTSRHYLALTPESRVFLRGVYEKHPKLNRPETRILSRVCRIADESIELLWQDLSEARKPYDAMKIFVTAREIEKGRRFRSHDQSQQTSSHR